MVERRNKYKLRVQTILEEQKNISLENSNNNNNNNAATPSP